MTAATKKKVDPKGKAPAAALTGFGDLSALLSAPDAGAAAAGASGGPIDLDLDLIDEDPNQPRTEDNPGFTEESLEELAVTIRDRGVKTPISVRENPDAPGRFIINHGARRTRASKRPTAGKTSIPAFIDPDYNEVDQVIENIQRNDLTAREIANFIGRELAKKRRKIDIAKSIGKSNSFVSQHVTLLDLPDPIAEVFNEGRCKDVTVINELVTAHKQKPEEVTAWLEDKEQEITRGSVKLLREFLDGGGEKAGGGTADEDGGGEPEEGKADAKKKEAKEPDPTKLKKAIVQVTHNERPARLMLDRRPSAEGFAWLKYEDDGHEFETSLPTVQLVALLEA